jgi:hypothetical protein
MNETENLCLPIAMDSSVLRAESERTYKGRYIVGLLEVSQGSQLLKLQVILLR